MDFLKEWLSSILFVQIIILLCEHLFLHTSFEKYIHFFTSFFMIICLLYPVFELTQNSLLWQKNYWVRSMENEWNAWKTESGMTYSQKEMKEQYKKAYRSQITQFANECGLDLSHVKIQMNEKSNTINEIDVILRNSSNREEESAIKKFRSTLITFYSLEESNINITIWE